MSNLIKYARREFAALKWPGDCPRQKEICKGLLALLLTFAKQRYSGSSASYTLKLFAKLAAFEPLGPLTGEANEWVEINDGIWQNNRCGTVFKTVEGAYNIDGIIWEDKNGDCYTNMHSRIKIKFPYVPKTVYRKAK